MLHPCAWRAAPCPGETPQHRQGAATKARAGRTRTPPRQVTLSPRSPAPGRGTAQAAAPEISFNVNLALRQLFLIFKLFHINPWPCHLFSLSAVGSVVGIAEEISSGILAEAAPYL